jgi:hypothetical protein
VVRTSVIFMLLELVILGGNEMSKYQRP